MAEDADARRARLLEREQELARALEQGRGAARPVELDQQSVGRLSRMDALQSQAMSAEAQRRRTLELSRVRSALGRLEEGTFGECVSCGEPIGDARLEHDPSVTQCLECARAR